MEFMYFYGFFGKTTIVLSGWGYIGFCKLWIAGYRDHRHDRYSCLLLVCSLFIMNLACILEMHSVHIWLSLECYMTICYRNLERPADVSLTYWPESTSCTQRTSVFLLADANLISYAILGNWRSRHWWTLPAKVPHRDHWHHTEARAMSKIQLQSIYFLLPSSQVSSSALSRSSCKAQILTSL